MEKMRQRFKKKKNKEKGSALPNAKKYEGKREKILISIKPGISKCFLDGPDSKQFRITSDHVSVTKYWTLPLKYGSSLRQYEKEWVRLCYKKAIYKITWPAHRS